MTNNINLSEVQLYNQIADWNHVKKFDYHGNKLSDDLRLNEIMEMNPWLKTYLDF